MNTRKGATLAKGDLATPIYDFLLDYHLSSMNGIEPYDRLHATEGLETIPAIIMSASLPQELLDKILT